MKWNRAKTRLLIALILAVGFFALLYIMIFNPVPPENSDVLKVLVGFMGGAFVTMVTFYFGDSEGSTKEVQDKQPEEE